jgi:hypothetical protein
VAKGSNCFRSAAAALLLICLIAAVTACASAPKGESVAECERALDSALARVDTTAHYPSQVRVDSTVKPGEVEGVVVSALTDSAIYGVQLYVHGPDSSRQFGQLADDEGRFHLPRRATSRVVIEARRIGFKTDSVRVDSAAGASVKIALRVQPMRVIPSCCPPLPKGSVCL